MRFKRQIKRKNVNSQIFEQVAVSPLRLFTKGSTTNGYKNYTKNGILKPLFKIYNIYK